MKNLKLYSLIALVTVVFGCEVLEHEPQQQISTELAFSNEKSAEAVLNGLYNEAQLVYSWRPFIFGDLASDAVQSIDTWDAFNQVDTYTNSADNTEVDDFYTQIYRGIDMANQIIANVPNVDMPAAKIDDFLGQAYTFRGMFYFELARYWSGIPNAYNEEGVVIRTTPSNGINEESYAPRASFEATWAQVLSDLQEGYSRLPDTRGNNADNRRRLTKPAAAAMMARTYFYQGNWPQAASFATEVISNSRFTLVEPFSIIYRTEFSDESIFEMDYNNIDFSGIRGWYYPPNLGGRGGVCFHPEYHTYLTNEAGDERANLIASRVFSGQTVYYSTKYDLLQNASNIPLLRIAEMHLIRAEARVNGAPGGAAGALSDLNAVRNRAGLDDVNPSGTNAILSAIWQERDKEFAIEGQRWFDLIRTGRAMSTLQDLTRTAGSSLVSIPSEGRFLMPIPNADILANPQMTQNSAYR